MIGAAAGPASYQEFWPTYVAQHLSARCRLMHFAGTALAIACVLVSPRFPPAALAAPVFGYGLAWSGHFVFEGNRPASWQSPRAALWSLRGDLRMFGLMLVGRMGGEIQRLGLATR